MRRASTYAFSPSLLIPLALGVLILLVRALLPFINQPDLGPTTLDILSASRKNNELGIERNGLILIPISASIMILLGLWSLANPKMGRAAALLCALAGVLGLEYFAVFFLDYMREGATYLPLLAIGFWVLLGLLILSVMQVLIPRPAASVPLRHLIANQESAIVIALIALVLFIGLSNPRFLATRNILDVLQGNAYIAVAAIGMTFVIVTGNIDISVGSLIGLLAIVSGRLVVAGAPVEVAWFVPLGLGALVGLIIGLLVAYLRVPSIVVTLGMLSIIKGGLILWTSGQRVTGMPPDYYLAQMKPFGLPMPIILMLVLTLVAALWMRYSPRGRSLYAVGGNAEAARLSGLSERQVVVMAFVLNGVFVGIASVMYATQLRVIQATPPPNLELAIITATVVGGVSILGGTGTVIGATLAAILLNTIRSGMIFIGISPFWIQTVQGTLILATVLIDLLRRRRQQGGG